MILLYRIFTIILYPFLFIFLYYRKLINKEDPIRFKEKILPGCFNVNKKNTKLIWFHASSIGEFRSIIPIINNLSSGKKDLDFLVTTSTVSSGNLAKIELKKFNNVYHRYFPFDVPFLMNKFIRFWNPDRIFLVDSEIWPNLILTAKKYKIPIALINARITSKSFKKWLIFSKTAKKIFGTFKVCICSNFETKKFLEQLELKNINYVGNIKLASQIDEKKIYNINKDFIQNKRFWFAASIHNGEEIFCLKTHIELKKKFNNILTIIAPRHIENSKKIKYLSERLNLKTQILNENEKILKNKEVVILNFFGALQNYFKYAKSVFMGKSMIEKLKTTGGQSPIEAAKLNCKIYHGPYVYNFEEIYKIFEKKNISKKISNIGELVENLSLDLKDPVKQKGEISESINELGNKTLSSTMRLVDNFLKNEIK
tara:strand:- start:954 stop:2234 length:1281 start_codon:yes stop_codon:yes gene_type:complete